jgi:PKD repeat protein
MNLNRYLLAFLLLLSGCSKKGSEGTGNNYSPAVTLSAEIIQVNPFTFRFTATATDQEFDPLSFKWDFGEGTLKTGTTPLVS